MEKKDIPTNHLFHEMIRVIERIQPRAFLFENVQGPSKKWRYSGEKGEIFRDVWTAFSSIEGYVTQPTPHSCLLLRREQNMAEAQSWGRGGHCTQRRRAHFLPTYSGQPYSKNSGTMVGYSHGRARE